jgi:FkbM family methyltransferase
MIRSTLLSVTRSIGIYKYWVSFREEYYPTASMRKMTDFYRQFVPAGSLCFDIGANMGNRVATFLKLGAKVVALEPQKSCLENLNRRFKNRAIIVGKGVSNKAGFQNLLVSDVSLLSSFSEEWVESIQDKFGHHNWDKTEKVEMTTLDALIAEYGVPHFVKIDVEGYELEVLEGLSQPVANLSFEYAFPYQKEKTIKCLQRLGQIMPEARYNYSKGESFEFASPKWLNNTELIAFFENLSLEENHFGDVYLKN